MLLFTILLSTAFLFLAGYVFHLRKQIQTLSEEIDHFLLYREAHPETLKEGLLSNLTNQIRKLEAQLLYEKQFNHKRETEMTQFIENMAHQIKTALTILQIHLDLAQTTYASSDLANSQASLERLTAEIERVLKSSQLASGKISMDFTTLNYPDCIQDCIRSLTSLAEKKNVSFACRMPAQCLISADAFWLSQAIENLLKNAVEHTPSGTSVQISLEESEKHVVLTVADSGKGVPVQELPLIFLRFHRGRISKAGYGIGLSMAQDIVKAHHGTLSARNLPEKGCSFLLSLPLFLDGRIYQEQ